jgi:hypothetical protein
LRGADDDEALEAITTEAVKLTLEALAGVDDDDGAGVGEVA